MAGLEEKREVAWEVYMSTGGLDVKEASSLMKSPESP